MLHGMEGSRHAGGGSGGGTSDIAARAAGHRNLAPSGAPALAPLAVLKLTILNVQLEDACGAPGKQLEGLHLLLRCGPHW